MKLALGTVQFGLHYGIANRSGQVSIAQAREVLNMARNHGIEDLDTAIAYGDSEARLGKIGIKGFRVVTKLPPMPVLMPDGVADAGAWAKSHLADSLMRLGSDCIYGLMMHRSTDLLGPFAPALLKALKEFQDQGLVEKLGISIYAPSELDEVMSLAQWGLVQAPFNLVDRRLHSSGWLRRLKDMGVEVHTRSTFLQGLLLTPPHLLPLKFAPWLQIWKSWYQWQEDTSSSAVGACLAFTQSFPEVDKIVVGVDGVKHLESIFAALSHPMNHNWPDIASEDERLVNPSKWGEL
jgi:aryl-alcohol dehydrogenase-like predicted oxidoreductase